MSDRSKTGKSPQTDNVDMLEADFDLPPDLSVGMQPANARTRRTEHKAAPDGDVIIRLYDINTRYVHTRVSSKVICRFSKFFQRELSSDFSKSRYRRSTANPTRIKLHDKEDGPGMATLCDLVHSGLDFIRDQRHGRTFHTNHLVRLAYLAVKYELTSHLSGDIASAVLGPFAQRTGRVGLDPSEVLNLVVAAFFLQHSELFNVFTRSLIIDHCTPVSALKEHPYFQYLGSAALIQLEEARFKACWSIESFVRETTDVNEQLQFPYASFALELAQKLSPPREQWPPVYYYAQGHTIRHVIETIAAYKSDAKITGPASLRATGKQAVNTLSAHCQDLAPSLNEIAAGLCFECTRDFKHWAECEHQDRLGKRAAAIDPLVAPATR